jgi:protein associated with RNAse G/E
MYLAKFDKRGLLWEITIFEKRWSDTMLSNELIKINTRLFIFHYSGYRWINREMSRLLFDKHKLEIING